MSKLYVGNIPWSATEDQIKAHFSQVANVSSVSIVTDRESGRSRGFAFVEVSDRDAALGLNGSDMGGRALVVNEARERAPRR